jgi:hypothetical protein
MTGIGKAGSRFAKLWRGIVHRVGRFLPYGLNNRAELDRTRSVPTEKAPGFLRETVTASAPKDLQQIGLASDLTSHVGEVTAAFAKPPTRASSEHSAVPAIDWQLPIPPQPEQRTVARMRVRQSSKRGKPQGRIAGGKGRLARAGCRRASRDLDWMREVLASS